MGYAGCNLNPRASAASHPPLVGALALQASLHESCPVTTQLGTAVLFEAYQPIKVCNESSAQKAVQYHTHARQMYPVYSK